VTSSVVVDTNVFTARLRRDSGLASQYAKHLAGEMIAVTPQTVAEARYGALKSGWGPRRITELRVITVDVTVLPVDAETVERVAQLRNECRRIGHALHQRRHNADLWIAAAAVRWSIPLVPHDAVFFGCPGLELRTALTR
jgi:predicted nucleic acid-binding protein